MAADKVVPFRRDKGGQPTAIVKVGGPVDEVNVTLALYSKDLEPGEISRALGVQPTSAHRRGDRKGPRSPGYRTGAWLLTESGRAPEQTEAVIARLLQQLPQEAAVWRELQAKYRIQIRLGVHMSGWNQGFSIPREQIERIAKLEASMEFDIYAHGDGE
jgi:hypothetical protein